MILVDRVRDIWGDGNVRYIVEFIVMMVFRLSEFEKYFNFVDKIIYKFYIFLLYIICYRGIIFLLIFMKLFVVEMCLWYFEKDYIYYWFILKDIEKKCLI